MTNILPDQANNYELYFDHNYRWVLGMNMIYAVITFMGLFLILDHETPKFYLFNGDQEKALKTLQIYQYDEDEDRQLRELIKKSNVKSIKVSCWDAFVKDPKFVRVSWMAMGITFFVCIIGLTTIRHYSNPIFTALFEENPTFIDA
jgi:hypothetical protein